MAKKQVTIPIFLPNQGCPNRCIFCNQGKSLGSSQVTTLTEAEAKIQVYLAKISHSIEIIEVAFFGGNFTGLPIKVQVEFLQMAFRFKQQGSIHRIRLSTRPDFLNPEKMKLLAKYQVDTIELGVQSFSNEVLNASARGHSAEDVYRAVELCRLFQINFVLQLMAGLPGDSREGAVSSAKRAALLKPAAVRIFPAVVLKDTVLAGLYLKGMYQPLDMNEAIEICKEMYLIFRENNIPVIRMGLHPFADEDIVAGPYHPSFGFFVKARVKRDELEQKISEILSGGDMELSLHIQLPNIGKEEYLGYKRENIRYLQSKFPGKIFKISIQGSGTVKLPVFSLS
jgi:histone acetyltransferase (RNA polymerase elongator complex component)